MDFLLNQPSAEVFIPDHSNLDLAIERTTHLAIGAHQDDLEIMAAKPILDCFHDQNQWFTGVVLTDGRGSPRDQIYADYSDEQMRNVRLKEQKKAAVIGEYSSLIMLDYPSKAIKNKDNQVIDDLLGIIRKASPKYIYTHNLADKHDTHVAAVLRVIQAIRSLPKESRPEKLFGSEVWRNLDWLDDNEKIALDLTDHDNIQMALLGVFDSQIAGGKRYDLAAMARRTTNATFFESHGVDKTQRLTFAMDLTPLIQDDNKSISSYTINFIDQFSNDVKCRLDKFG